MFPVVFSANGQAGGYRIANSLRFRSSASAYLNRTPGSASNRTTWTWSGWVKIGLIQSQTLFEAQNGTTFSRLQIDGNLNFSCVGGTSAVVTTFNVASSAIIRDPSAWYHFVAAFDTTQATASNRIKLYINGVQVSSFTSSSYPSQNSTWSWNSVCPHNIGRYVDSTYGAGGYLDGYMADINFMDGQALTPSSFGEFNPTTGVWQPKQYSGTYGTNGFKLNFSNGTSTTTLGYDSSGNGNNWTTNNISLTSGSTYDSMWDSPTSYDNGVNGVGNYAVLNAVASDGTISNANLTVAWVGGNSAKPSTIGMSSGKWYCEIYMNSVGTAALPGLIPSTMIPTVGYPGSTSGSYGYYYDGQKYTGGAGSAYGASYTTGDIIGISFDADAGSLTFYKNGVSQGVAFSGIAAGTWFFAAGHSGTCTMSLNFGQRPFAYTPPSGYKTLCTQNLPVVTIQNGAAYMAATLYTGTGSTQSISNAVNSVSFQPDFVWLKCRSSARINGLWDSVRGATKYLSSNSTDAEATDATNGVISFQSNGYTVGATGTWNFSGDTFVGWQWKAGGTAVTNTAGSITSSVSANQTAGFSVVTWTNPASGTSTVGHGLGVAPSLIILKGRDIVSSWSVYHASVGNTGRLVLNTTAATDTSSSYWNNTSPTSSVFTLGTGFADSSTRVAYCFAAIPGYSAFGSYTGNGSSDGPFVYCGFRPRWILYKSTAGNWGVLYDTSENPYNVSSQYLIADSSAAQNNGGATNNGTLDILSNGFKLRDNSLQSNNSGTTYIYAAFAENPFKYSLAR